MSAEIKDKVLKSARQLISKNGFANLTISKVAKAANISKSHVYYYFDSKSELVCQLIDEQINKYMATRELFDEAEPIIKKINILFDYVQSQTSGSDSDSKLTNGSMLIDLALESVQNGQVLNEKIKNVGELLFEDLFFLVKESNIFENDEDVQKYSAKIFSSILGSLVIDRLNNSGEAVQYLKSEIINKLVK